MRIYRMKKKQAIPKKIDEVWEFFSSPHNLNKITPPDLNFIIVSGGESPMYPGQIIEYRVEFIRNIRSLWLTEITHVQENEFFVDEQRLGPYALWHHEHHFKRVNGGTLMTDIITYSLPLSLFGTIAHALVVRKRLEHIFSYRSHIISEIFGSMENDF